MKRNIMMICPEKIAYHDGRMTREQLPAAAAPLRNAYGQYLLLLVN